MRETSGILSQNTRNFNIISKDDASHDNLNKCWINFNEHPCLWTLTEYNINQSGINISGLLWTIISGVGCHYFSTHCIFYAVCQGKHFECQSTVKPLYNIRRGGSNSSKWWTVWNLNPIYCSVANKHSRVPTILSRPGSIRLYSNAAILKQEARQQTKHECKVAIPQGILGSCLYP